MGVMLVTVGKIPEVRIDSDGTPMRTSITVDGVMIPCSKITWTIEHDGLSSCVFEVHKVVLNAEAEQVVARYIEPEVSGEGR